MIVPIRCFSCGKPVAQAWEEYSKRVQEGEEPGKVMDSLDIKRYCCRRMLLSHKDFIKDILKYKNR
ncbi:MAG: DNA-directed RNA polymerase subunit N [Candidatus Micrarchaeota archaeon]